MLCPTRVWWTGPSEREFLASPLVMTVYAVLLSSPCLWRRPSMTSLHLNLGRRGQDWASRDRWNRVMGSDQQDCNGRVEWRWLHGHLRHLYPRQYPWGLPRRPRHILMARWYFLGAGCKSPSRSVPLRARLRSGGRVPRAIGHRHSQSQSWSEVWAGMPFRRQESSAHDSSVPIESSGRPS